MINYCKLTSIGLESGKFLKTVSNIGVFYAHEQATHITSCILCSTKLAYTSIQRLWVEGGGGGGGGDKNNTNGYKQHDNKQNENQ